MAQLSSDVRMEAEKRAEAWEMQKMEMRSQNDFQLSEYRHQVKVMAAIEKEQRESQERERKIKAIDKLLQEGEITPEQHTYLKTATVTGTRLPTRTTKANSMADILANMMQPTQLTANQMRAGGEIAPTPQQLRAQGTEGAYKQGVRLGYWK
jgi:hypothetical protein